MFRFIHTSDWHLAKPFGRFDSDLPAFLKKARFDRIEVIAREARAHGAAFVLVAGDTFDAETPPPQVVRHALHAMEAAGDITWVLLPGNHDSLAASDLWRRIERDRPGNVILALEPRPIELPALDGTPVVILPAPPTVRSPGRDLTEWMDDAAPEDGSEADWSGAIRVGLAHGSIQSFGEGSSEAGVIAPDRSARANLDYLALGDWHGEVRVGPRCCYSGTPEADAFRVEGTAGVLLVEIEGPGAEPRVTTIETGEYLWRSAAVDLRPGDDLRERLDEVLPSRASRRQALVYLSVTGRVSMADRAALVALLQEAAYDFAYFEENLDELGIDQAVLDLDDIARSGALRDAAEELWARAAKAEPEDHERRVLTEALARLYGYAQARPAGSDTGAGEART